MRSSRWRRYAMRRGNGPAKSFQLCWRRMWCRRNMPAKYVDVFCERGAFTQEQSEKVLAAARKHGLGTRAHVCQFTPAQLKPLLEHQPASFDQMDCVQPDDISL